MSEKWKVNIADDADDDLEFFTTKNQHYWRRRIEQALEHKPFVKSSNKKPVPTLTVAFAEEGVAVWQLKIVPYRALYRLDPEGEVRVLRVEEVFKKIGETPIRRERKRRR